MQSEYHMKKYDAILSNMNKLLTLLLRQMTHCNCKLLYENAIIINKPLSPFCWGRWPATLSSQGCNSSRGSRRKATCNQWVIQCVPIKSFTMCQQNPPRGGVQAKSSNMVWAKSCNPENCVSKPNHQELNPRLLGDPFFNETESKIIKWNENSQDRDVTVNLKQIRRFLMSHFDIC